MKNSLKFQVGVLFLLILTQVSWSKGASTECPKFSESMCAEIQTKSESDTLWVDIVLVLPYAPKPDSCKNVELKTHPECEDKMDSAFWANLKLETEEVYTKYSSKMMDVAHPSQAIPYPGDSTGVFYGAIMTKTNILSIVQDTNVVGAELFYSSHPIKIRQPTTLSKNPDLNWLNYSLNGQLIKSTTHVNSFKVRIQK